MVSHGQGRGPHYPSHQGWYSMASPALQPGLMGPVWGRQGRDGARGGPDAGVRISSLWLTRIATVFLLGICSPQLPVPC